MTTKIPYQHIQLVRNQAISTIQIKIFIFEIVDKNYTSLIAK